MAQLYCMPSNLGAAGGVPGPQAHLLPGAGRRPGRARPPAPGVGPCGKAVEKPRRKAPEKAVKAPEAAPEPMSPEPIDEPIDVRLEALEEDPSFREFLD